MSTIRPLSDVEVTEFDKKACDSTAQLIKAAIPYASAPASRFLAVAAKFLELKNALECVQNTEPTVNICALPGEKPKPEEMLADLKKYCDPSQAEMIDKMLGFFQMAKVYEKYKDMEKNPEFQAMMNMFKNTMGPSFESKSPPPSPAFNSDTFQSLKNMLTPEQQQMYDTLMAMNQMKEP